MELRFRVEVKLPLQPILSLVAWTRGAIHGQDSAPPYGLSILARLRLLTTCLTCQRCCINVENEVEKASSEAFDGCFVSVEGAGIRKLA